MLCSFSYEDIKAIEYGDVMDELDYYIWIVVDAWQNLRADAHGNSSREDFEWAMSIVHSRSFGSAGKKGPSDIHMLVPVADMFNHGGDVCRGLFKEPFEKLDSVQWAILPPEKSTSGEWEMTFVTSTEITAGEEVELSLWKRKQ